MKKALALVLALVLALSMGVSAFALVTLKPVTPANPGLINLPMVEFDADGEYAKVYEGGTYYFRLQSDKNFSDIKVVANGNVTAEVVEFDPTKMTFDTATATTDDDVKFLIYNSNLDKYKNQTVWDTKANAETFSTYASAKAEADAINKGDDNKNTYCVVVPSENIYVIKMVIADNYTAHYTTGSIKIEAYNKDTKKTEYATVYTVNDIINFEYEEVKHAALYNATIDGAVKLTVNGKGYSDYDANVLGYKGADKDYDYTELRQDDKAAVVSTTAFRAIAGQNLTVVSNDITVAIEKVAAGQKGVNFQGYSATQLNAEGYTEADWAKKSTAAWEIASIDFGFYGNQVIKSDFTVSIIPKEADGTAYDWFTLREAFGLAVEEDDIITYYVLKDGKVVTEYVVDYMTIGDALYDDVEIEIDLKDSTLGEYSIVLEVPASESAAEESNPNTGAESVVGVVAALAVVSLASAAAVSLKK